MSFVANPKRPELLSTCPWSNVRRHLGTTCRYFKRNVTELTSVRYPHLQRGEYAELGSADIETFRSLLPDDGQILTGEEAIGYNTDWLRVARGLYHVHVCLFSDLEIKLVILANNLNY